MDEPKPTSHQLPSADRTRIDAMHRHGETSPHVARRTLLYFYPVNEDACAQAREQQAYRAAQCAVEAGWRIAMQHDGILALESDHDILVETILARNVWASAFAAQMDLQYDGWESEVINSLS